MSSVSLKQPYFVLVNFFYCFCKVNRARNELDLSFLKMKCVYGGRNLMLRTTKLSAAFVIVCFYFWKLVQSVIMEAFESKSLTSRKACWSLNCRLS